MINYQLFVPYLVIILSYVFLLLNKIKVNQLFNLIICILLGCVVIFSYIYRQYYYLNWLILITLTPILGTIIVGVISKNKLVTYSLCLLIIFSNLAVAYEPNEEHQLLGNLYLISVIPASIIAFITLVILDLVKILVANSSVEQSENSKKSLVVFCFLVFIGIISVIFLGYFKILDPIFFKNKILINSLIATTIFYTLNSLFKLKARHILLFSIIIFLFTSSIILNFIYILVFKTSNDNSDIILNLLKSFNIISQFYLHQISIFMFILTVIFYFKTQKIGKSYFSI